MNIAVCAKPIPDPASPGSLSNSNTLVRPDKLILDDSDRYGVELALQLVEAAGEGSVTVYAMSPLGDATALRTALAMGADRVVHVVDDSLAGSDSLVTARVLAAAISREPFDLVLAGTESSDGYAGVMPSQLAELLDVASITFATSAVVGADTVQVARQTEKGSETVRCALPALITVTAGIVSPRYPSFKGIMAAKSKPYDQVTVSDLSVNYAVGWSGSQQEVISVEDAPMRAAGEKIVDEGDGEQRIISFLETAKVL